MDSPCSSSGSSSTKLQKTFRKAKRNLSYADLHSEVKNDVNIKPPSSGMHQKQHGRSKGLQKEELVKYMSELPSYLEKGGKVKAKPLNLGVLDWHSLENWQNFRPRRPNNRYSTSSSITSSSLWTESNGESSNHYGKGDDTCSPGSLKVRRPSLQSYLNISPLHGNYEHVESRARNSANYTFIKDIPTNLFAGQKNVPTESVFQTKSSELELKECKRENLDSLNISNTRSSSKGKLKVQGYASKRKSEKLQNQYNNSKRHVSPDGYNDVVLPVPRESTDRNHSRPLNLTGRSQELQGFSVMSSDEFHLEEVNSPDLYPSILDSCAVTRGIDGSEEPRMEQKFSCAPSCAIKSVTRQTNKILKEKSSIMPIFSTSIKSLKILNMKGTISDSEARNPSPSCRLSFVFNRIRGSDNSRDSSDVPQFSSEDVIAKSGSEIAGSFVCPNNTRSDQYNAVSRDYSSPLKRLLNPLLKTKAANSKFADHSQKNLTSTRRASTSFAEQGELSSVHQMKEKFDLTNLRTPCLDKTHHNKIRGSSTLQAYFQVSAKNDLPLFTFAVDNNSDVLAATLRKFSSRKNDLTWIYTFFSIHETRRKSGGWLTQGGKFKDYVPNVVAQMKVSDLPFSNLGEHLTVEQLSTREFVLYAVDLRLFDYQRCDMQPNDELAAIVVKFPRKIVTCMEDSSQNVRGASNSRDLQEDKDSLGSQEIFSTTVVLPGGIHGLPGKGEPWPLIERWLSGGHCDCGGWDLGCKVKVLGNKNQKPNGQFELFSQSEEKAQPTTPFFMLSSLKNGIFSVEFSSTLSLLQAFSICVAVFDSMKPSELQQPRKYFEEKLAEGATLHDFGPRTPKLVRDDVPARSASQPPHTLVERV